MRVIVFYLLVQSAGLEQISTTTVPTETSTSIYTAGPSIPCHFSCSFDMDFCSWTQSDTDSFDWTRHKGPTSSTTTGPSYDHTTGEGYYIYLESNDANPGDTAHLVSPTCTSDGPRCFRFWYHMYGVARTMALHVYVVSGGGAPELVWSQMGNKGNRWNKAEITLTQMGRLQIILEGVRGEDFRSDVAVDDISITEGYCPGKAEILQRLQTDTQFSPPQWTPPQPPLQPTQSHQLLIPAWCQNVMSEGSIRRGQWGTLFITYIALLLSAAISCPLNSHYEPCANACPGTCVDPTAPGTCSLPCTEACVCDSGFLLNSGTCVPSHQCGCWENGKHYPVGTEFWTDDTCSSKCVCPRRGGRLECPSAHCPKDHYCGVQNGVPGCYPHTYGVCRVHNDPHYNTFDKATHHFMGNCTYTLARLCANTTGLPFFNIEAKNEHRFGNPSVSYVQRVLVEVDGHWVEIVKGHPSQVLVNKIWMTLPVHSLNGSISVERNGRYVRLETDFHLSVSYDTDHSVEIRVPTRYFNQTCGMCGNFNDHIQDDHMMPNGEQAKSSTELGNSWQVPNAEYDRPSCGAPNPNVSHCPPEEEDLYSSGAFCGLLTSSQGPLAACLSVINPGSFFESCVFDLCVLGGSQQLLCSALEAYADTCQRAGVDLPSWRNATFCPLSCSSNSHYKPCTSSCPATCSNPWPSGNCSKPCVEGCECNKGFVLSGGHCVPMADCGCLVGGRYFEKGETFWKPDCVGHCRCAENGSLICSSETCPEGQICKVQEGALGCHMSEKATCHIYGDPHYITFDGRLYHFQGSCNYTAVKVCTNSSEHFSVMTRNEHRGSKTWTALNSVVVSFQNLHIALRKNKEVYVNGAKVEIPVNLPMGIRVEHSPPYVVLKSPFGLLAKFDGDQELLVQVDERHKGRLCGLCGTYSSSQLDDFQKPDGNLEYDQNVFGNSWRVPDDDWMCDSSTVVPPSCDPIKEIAFEKLCNVLLTSKGPFADCHWSVPPQLYFETCVYDQCATEGDTNQFCKSLEAYATACEQADVALGDWRKDTTCGECSIEMEGVAAQTKPSSTALPATSTATGPTTTTKTKTTTPTHAPGPSSPCDFSCSFDVDFCSWTQSNTDSFDWTRHKGPTSSTNTGPSYDHTTGDGYFIYLESNDANPGDMAHLVSPTCTSLGPHCFHFWYHMYGVARTMALRVYVVSGDGAPELVWSQMGNKGNRWNRGDITITHTGRLQIILEGVRGEDFRSDVAVDDISVTEGYCPGHVITTTTTTTTTGKTTSPAPPTLESCMVSGDPHYYTFDKQTHHFMGNCTYTLSQLCDPNISLLPYFNVEATNEHRWGNTQVSYVRSVDIDVHGIRVTLEKGGTVKPSPQLFSAAISCAPNSHYEPCANACPGTCVDPTAPGTCSLPCTEACACDSGFLLHSGTCVPSHQCGCWEKGKHYPVGTEFWTDDTCSSKCICPRPGGRLECPSAHCPKDHYCGIQNGVPGCYPHTYGVCRVHNDPHYNTFDKATHHFMGNCTYTLVRLCGNTAGLPFFNIEAKNEHRWGNPSVSYVQRVLVEVYGQQFEIVKNDHSHVLVNKVLTTLPVHRLNGSISVERNGRYVRLETDFHLSVSYDTDHSVEIRVPTSYFNQTCGMCGNFNDHKEDDHMMPNGEQARSSTELGNSWQVPNAEYDHPSCGAPNPNVSHCPPEEEDLYSSEAFCGLLTSSQGPLAACLSVINPGSFFESCVFDLCALGGSQQLLCSALEAYADTCQRAGVDLPSWRNATFCRE
ncbi:hypothetical protein JD844_007761 [Phrynosoma platyrhinos]|uniref:Zonadhesin n=1 Tax=Phrynosoma platyrhinos TaxID=52577 RepID=A0ABQ7T3Y3_PHRPL|nr:hypothetical protein JD844_007761 [Phrynosoma platyrhinos]